MIPEMTISGMSRPLTVDETVKCFLGRRDFLLDIAHRFGSPLYVIDEAVTVSRAREFMRVFSACLPGMEAFFPIKTNSHKKLLETLVNAGLGLEASSGVELKTAIEAGARKIVFNGPAKTDAEIDLALDHSKRVILILDSGTEFRRLEALTQRRRIQVQAGVRLAVKAHGPWRKFGISLAELPAFLGMAAQSKNIDLNGLHFHTSWNMTPDAQVHTLVKIGEVLRTLSPDITSGLEFIDIGGGFWPPQGLWEPIIRNRLEDTESSPMITDPGEPAQGGFHTTVYAAPLTVFAERIGEAFRTHILPYMECRVYAEPGRWIVNDAMHLLLTVMDIKGNNDVVLTDGGTSMIGWERFESEYFPVINLTHPAMTEKAFPVMGSLCTPDDLWGRSCFASELSIGDVLLIPMQGAYTYSLRQQFIKAIPKTVFVPAADESAAYEVPGP